jgi:hypothetical protein
MVNIGILIKKPENVFSNGCIQQAYFILKIMQNCGFKCDFMAIEPDYKFFDVVKTPIVTINENFDFSSYDILIFSSLILLSSTNTNLINHMKKFNLKMINIICGNLFILHQEEFVFGHHNIMKNYFENYFDEQWVLEMYDYSKDYIQMLTKTYTKITPYVWNIDFIKTYVNNNNLLKNITNNNDKVNLLIFEPNMSIHKNALIPLLIAEEYYEKYNNVNKVYIFCGDKVISNQNNSLINNLKIYKEKKIECYGRIVMPYIMDVIMKNNDYMNIVLSYTLLNNLNFLHLEMFHLGIPIIHNCKPFQKNKLYYDDNNQLKAVELIEYTRKNFNREQYMNDCMNIINEYSYDNKDRIDRYCSCVEKLMNNDKNKEFNFLNYNLLKETYYGEGYVTYINNLEEVKKINELISILENMKNRLTLQIIYNPDINFEIDIPFNELINIEFYSIKDLYNDDCDYDEISAISLSTFKIVNYININTKKIQKISKLIE